MLRPTLIFAITVILFSCKVDTKAKKGNMIRGDWVSERVSTDFRKTPLIFSFTDTDCIIRTPFNNRRRYSINNDILSIHHDSLEGTAAGQSKYIIINLTADSLCLQPVASDGLVPDVMRLKRIKETNMLIPEKIFFVSSGCFGTCPSLYLEIDSSRNMLFYGLMHTDKKGGYKGKINTALYNEICKKIRQLSLKELKEYYEAGWTDDQYCGVAVKANGKIISSSAYGFNEEPAALRILLNFLMDLYQKAELVDDSAVTRYYFEAHPEFSKVTSKIRLPPVDPPPIK